MYRARQNVLEIVYEVASGWTLMPLIMCAHMLLVLMQFF